MKKIIIIALPILLIIALTGCSSMMESGDLQNAGMLVESSVHDDPWNKKGYKGLLAIEEKFDVDVFYKEGVRTEHEVKKAVDELVSNGVNLIFGHSSTYGVFFEDIAETYPDVHFVYFNGGQFSEDVTSLNFNSHAMGFFGGMMAGKMTGTNHVGVIGAFEWQPEIEGFYEGVKYQNPDAEVVFNYVNSWNDQQTAMTMYGEMRSRNVDVVYPTGDAYSTSVIKQASDDGIYTIGYVADQSSVAEETVLTSTVQHVQELYEMAANNFNEGDLRGGVLTFDFQEDAISLGTFSPEVPKDFRKKILDEVEAYKENGLLPNERN
ncbi:BMP family ABC transporter substrate-binding protein [Lentibacillus lipolyticus]|nr:BMP family ABC transporter substrate-binding protein [Lentibacillus lipolyticus]